MHESDAFVEQNDFHGLYSDILRENRGCGVDGWGIIEVTSKTALSKDEAADSSFHSFLAARPTLHTDIVRR